MTSGVAQSSHLRNSAVFPFKHITNRGVIKQHRAQAIERSDKAAAETIRIKEACSTISAGGDQVKVI